MKYEITKEQIDSIINLLFQVNTPVQAFEGARKMFTELPVIKEAPKKEGGK